MTTLPKRSPRVVIVGDWILTKGKDAIGDALNARRINEVDQVFQHCPATGDDSGKMPGAADQRTRLDQHAIGVVA